MGFRLRFLFECVLAYFVVGLGRWGSGSMSFEGLPTSFLILVMFVQGIVLALAYSYYSQFTTVRMKNVKFGIGAGLLVWAIQAFGLPQDPEQWFIQVVLTVGHFLLLGMIFGWIYNLYQMRSEVLIDLPIRLTVRGGMIGIGSPQTEPLKWFPPSGGTEASKFITQVSKKELNCCELSYDNVPDGSVSLDELREFGNNLLRGGGHSSPQVL